MKRNGRKKGPSKRAAKHDAKILMKIRARFLPEPVNQSWPGMQKWYEKRTSGVTEIMTGTMVTSTTSGDDREQQT